MHEESLPPEGMSDRLASLRDLLTVGAGEAAFLRHRLRRWLGAAVEARTADAVERLLASLLAGEARLGHTPELAIEVYRGFGDPGSVRIPGRILVARPGPPPSPSDHPRENLARVLRDFLAQGIAGATLRARIGAKSAVATTDAHGFFEVDVAPPRRFDGHWLPVEVELVRGGPRGARARPARGEALVVRPGAPHAVVSDIDDTILESHTDGVGRMIWTAISGNALTRRTLDGMPALLRTLAGTDRANPIFYLSRSPWNLHTLLSAFLAHNNFPRGPLLLRRLGHGEVSPTDFKRRAIEDLLARFPALPFVLVGDDGEDDPHVYLDLAAAAPGRVQKIYVRPTAGAPAAAPTWRARAACAGVELVVLGAGL